LLPLPRLLSDGAHQPVAIEFKTSAFDNGPKPVNWKKPLRDKELTDSIEVNS
jgi:hypothetical protein